MSDTIKPDGGPAFPMWNSQANQSGPDFDSDEAACKHYARLSYAYADAMLAAKEHK